MTHILLACEFYYPSVGGVQGVMRQVAERLVARGHSVAVATTRLPERKSGELSGVTIAEFDVSGNAVTGVSGEVEAYRQYLLQGDYDVVMVKAAQQWTSDGMVPMLDRMTQAKGLHPVWVLGAVRTVVRRVLPRDARGAGQVRPSDLLFVGLSRH